MFNRQTIERLIEGISSIISESRSSLSVGDVELLYECIGFLETAQNTDNPDNPVSQEIVVIVVRIFLQVLLSHDINELKDLLF